VLPVAEAVCVALGVAADHCDEGEGEDDQDEDDLGKSATCRLQEVSGLITLPPLSQNSASPKTLMARTLRILSRHVSNGTNWREKSPDAASRY
jgi:hypothetical protein